MIRPVLVAAIVLVAIIVTPHALGNPAFNSADLILILSPVAVLAVGWPRRSRTLPRPVSERYREVGGDAGFPMPASPRDSNGDR